jgi:L-cysteine desulfidase
MRAIKFMTNTGERREILARLNAKENEGVHEAQQLESKIKQLIASKDVKSQIRSAKASRGRTRGHAV